MSERRANVLELAIGYGAGARMVQRVVEKMRAEGVLPEAVTIHEMLGYRRPAPHLTMSAHLDADVASDWTLLDGHDCPCEQCRSQD